MKNPNSKQVHILADLFQLLSYDIDAKADMQETEFNVCGTTACHAGWFAVANGKNRTFSNSMHGSYGFTDASNEMAQFLGFARHFELEAWATDNPNLWGNAHGNGMFCDIQAFGVQKKRNSDIVSLLTISKHWRQVAERLETLERRYDNHVKDTVAKYR